jgi:hypothetical protein
MDVWDEIRNSVNHELEEVEKRISMIRSDLDETIKATRESEILRGLAKINARLDVLERALPVEELEN